MLALIEVKWSVFFSGNLALLAFFKSFRFFSIIATAFGCIYCFEQSILLEVGSNHLVLSCIDVRRSLFVILCARLECGPDIVHQRDEREHRVMRVAYLLAHKMRRPLTLPRCHDEDIRVLPAVAIQPSHARLAELCYRVDGRCWKICQLTTGLRERVSDGAHGCHS